MVLAKIFFALQTSELVPGVEWNNMSTAHNMVADFHTKMMNGAWSIFLVLLAIAGGLIVFNIMAELNMDAKELLNRGLIVTFLLVGFNPIFGGIMKGGDLLASQIASKQDLARAADKAREFAGDPAEEDNGIAGKLWGLIKGILKVVNNGLLVTIVQGLVCIIFIIATLFINTLWIVFVIALYVFGPLSIVLGAIPKVGGKLIETWIGACVQLSIWQVWMAICWWFVSLGTELVVGDLSGGSVSGTLSAGGAWQVTGLSLVFACLYFATPFIVQGLIPISSFSFMAAFGARTAVMQVQNLASTAQSSTKSLNQAINGGGKSASRGASSGAASGAAKGAAAGPKGAAAGAAKGAAGGAAKGAAKGAAGGGGGGARGGHGGGARGGQGGRRAGGGPRG